MDYDYTWTYMKRQWFNKDLNLADKKLRREDPVKWKKNKRTQLEKVLAALGK